MKLTMPQIKVSFPKLNKLKLPSLGGKKGLSLSVYITDNFVRILELDSNKKPVFEPVEYEWTGKRDDEKKVILKQLAERNGLVGREVISCLTARDGILKVQRYPASMPKKDMMDALNWYIHSETGQIKEETVYDYYLNPSSDKYVQALVTIARKSTVDRLKEMLEAAGFKPRVIDYELIAIINYGLYKDMPVPFAILYIDKHSTMLVYYSEASVSFNEISFDFKTAATDPVILNQFVIEVRNMLVINEISSVYLAGAVLENQDILDEVMSNLPVLGLLDLEDLPSSFFVPYTLSIRGMEE